jgi:hypothetical protein
MFEFLSDFSDLPLLISLLPMAMTADVKRRVNRMLNSFILIVGDVENGMNYEV